MPGSGNELYEVRRDALTILSAAIAAVAGDAAVRRWLTTHAPREPFALVAVGKAAAAMLEGAQSAAGAFIEDQMVITSRAYAAGLSPAAEWIEGAHPVADERSLAAGEALMDFIARLPPDRRVVLCISGGASSMIEVPRPGVDAGLLSEANRWLLASGLAIREMNAVRKALSRIKGGGLLDFLGDREITELLISDVPGDDSAVIGSGLLTPDPSAAGVLSRIELPPWLANRVGGFAERRARASVTQVVVASNGDARQAAATEARRLGYPAFVNDDLVVGDAVAAGETLARQLRDAPPGIQVWGGETTVQLPSRPGRGGRNQHLALAAALRIAGSDTVALLSAGTDGRDGPGDDAGALVDGGTIARGWVEGLDPEKALDCADSGSFLEASGDLVNLGATGTNVMDLMIGWKGVRP